MIRKINIVLVMVLLTSIVANAFAPLSVVAVSNDTMFYNEMILTALVEQRPFVIDMLTGDTFGSNPNAEIHGLDGKSFHYKELLDELAENEILSTVIGLAYFENIVEEVGTQIIAAAATGAQTTIHALLSFYPEMKPEALASVSTTQICNALGVELTSENADKYSRIRDNVRQVGDTIVFLQNKIKLEGSVQKSYGAILNHALTKTYTSSAGNTTAFEETDMGVLKTISEFMKLTPEFKIESMNIEEKIDLPDIAKNIKDVGTLINDRIMVDHTNAYTKALFSSTKNAGESQLYTLFQMIKYDKSHASGATNRYTRFSIQSQLALDTLQKDGIYQYLATKQAWRNHILKLSNKTSLILNNGLEEIDNYAFNACTKLTSIHIPASVTYIRPNAFGAPALIEITVSDNSQDYRSVDGILYNKDMTELLRYPAAKPGTAFTIPDRVTTIISAAFCGTAQLQSLSMSDSVRKIDPYALSEMPSLTSLHLSDNITHLSDRVLAYNTSITEYTMPKNLKVIEKTALQGCPKLTYVKFQSDAINYNWSTIITLTNKDCVFAYPRYATGWSETYWWKHYTLVPYDQQTAAP